MPDLVGLTQQEILDVIFAERDIELGRTEYALPWFDMRRKNALQIGSLLHRASRGVPRLVNILAHKALLLVFGEGRRCASRRHVHAAALDTPSAASVTGWWWPRLRAGRATD
jgi:hypothetical protein